MSLLFAIGMLSIPVYLIISFVAFCRLLAYLFSSKKHLYKQRFFIANGFWIFSIFLIIGFLLYVAMQKAGGASGLFVPLFMPIPTVFGVFYLVLASNDIGKE